ncbi:efflux RND transporter periplasmic adaptor subunit [Segnochrobactraceae bacterium EtOH-i3]
MTATTKGWRRGRSAAHAGALLVVLGASLPGSALAQTAAPVPAVTVSPVVSRDITRQATFVGRVEAIQQVELKARVQGFLDTVAFAEGAYVKSGDLLYQIEQDTFQASLLAAQGNLGATQAAQTLAQINLDRQKTLVKSGTVSQAIVDTAQAQYDQAAAQTMTAQANVQTAQLNLGFTTIKAPISGRIGKTNYTIGNLVDQGSGTLATLIQMDPIRVAFSIPEKDYVTVTRAMDELAKSATAEETEGGNDISADMFRPTVILPDGSAYPEAGRIEFINNRVDPNTGTVTVRAEFTNAQNLLLAGQFVTVNVQVGDTTSENAVPQPAILQDKQGNYVFVVGADNRVVSRRVTVGVPGPDGMVPVLTGLQLGEDVIVDGVQKVREGELVKPVAAEASATTTTKTPATKSTGN